MQLDYLHYCWNLAETRPPEDMAPTRYYSSALKIILAAFVVGDSQQRWALFKKTQRFETWENDFGEGASGFLSWPIRILPIPGSHPISPSRRSDSVREVGRPTRMPSRDFQDTEESLWLCCNRASRWYPPINRKGSDLRNVRNQSPLFPAHSLVALLNPGLSCLRLISFLFLYNQLFYF